MQTSKLSLITISVLLGCTEQDQTVKGVDDYKAEALAVVVAYDVPNSLEFVGDDSVVFVDVHHSRYHPTPNAFGFAITTDPLRA